MSAPRTTREALIAEMLGSLDTLLDRVESLPALVATTEEKLSRTVVAVDSAGDKYRAAVTAFTEQAKADLAEYLDRKAAEVSSKTAEDQRTTIQNAAPSESSPQKPLTAKDLDFILTGAAKHFRTSFRSRLAEHAATASIASSVTAILVYAVLK